MIFLWNNTSFRLTTDSEFETDLNVTWPHLLWWLFEPSKGPSCTKLSIENWQNRTNFARICQFISLWLGFRFGNRRVWNKSFTVRFFQFESFKCLYSRILFLPSWWGMSHTVWLMRYDSWSWLIRWRRKRVITNCNFGRVFTISAYTKVWKWS